MEGTIYSRPRQRLGSTLDSLRQRRRRLRNAIILAIGISIFGALFAFAHYQDPQAMTFPVVGPVYFVLEPDPDLIRHENCHDARRRQIGDLAFYSDYLLGGAAREEARCMLPGQTHRAFNLPLQKPYTKP